MKNVWDWHQQCSDSAVMWAFRATKTRAFRLTWWREWRLECLLQGRLLAPAEIKGWE